MKSAVLTKAKKIEILEKEMPQITKKNEVMIRVKAVGICGTDLHIFEGKRNDVEFPRIMGHELSGEIVGIGENVKKVKLNDHVIFDPVIACNTCKICLKGHKNVCSNVKCFGVQMDGGFQEYIVVEEENVFPYEKTIDFKVAALGEPFSIAANILERASAKAGDCMVIIGAGTIGLAILQAAKGMGVKVLISDVSEVKLKYALEFGADVVINTKNESLEAALEKFSPGGADVLVDAVGIAPLFEQTLALAAPTARVVVIGFDGNTANISPVSITKRELTIVGSRMNCSQFDKVVNWLKQGIITDKMISREYPLQEIQKAFEETLANSDTCMKTIIAF